MEGLWAAHARARARERARKTKRVRDRYIGMRYAPPM